jgi:leader peptidase (prepilin peptidase)/N-methyltransferase
MPRRRKKTRMSPFAVFYTLLGLAVGSFLNLCIHRIPGGESIVTPGSRCPHCKKAVRPYDNIPLVSYLVLRGKCRFCKSAISFRYPLVELLTGLAFWGCLEVWGFTPPTLVNSLFLSLLIVLVFVDYDHQVLPDRITKPGIVAGVFLSPFQSEVLFQDAFSYRIASALPGVSPETLLPWAGSLLGALVGGGILWITGYVYRLVRKKKGLGLGDVKMMAMVGAFLGWPMALLTIFVGSLLGSILGIFLILFKGKTLQTKLAFGTLLGGGAAFSLFFGLSFVRWYHARLLERF